MKSNRKTKDTVFTKLFGEPKYAFQLYKVFHPEDTLTTEDQLKIITLENIFTVGAHNDLGLLVNDRLMIFVEAQSSWNGNMPIRALFYLAETYKRYILDTDTDIMAKTPAALPLPEVYVIFTGERENKPDTMRLSDHFVKDGAKQNSGKNSLELIVKMVYDGDEGDIVFQYVNFCKVFNAQLSLHPDDGERVVKETFRICKDRSLLVEFIKKHKSEVSDIMSDLVFNDEVLMEIHIRHETRIAREEGRAEGKAMGLEEGRVEGREEGIAEGRAESAAQLQKYRELLQANGIPIPEECV